ncbi:TonB-dependent receptor [Xanthomonas translucens]|uniref:TonB-dependent outer membrane receptor n=1 Tax=Xanthomonas translucens pv. translucens DSM 18974 TaxID=1261556 RepID=A0A1C3THY1_XANCT|nr:TonB-dependent receptor [Xanthomonas translucens]ELQ15941.1 TonB-dependent outer membrane receptor [Xanthomonas translucens DAR61454]KTF39492.1 TonB-dependent receptor [Xanthomonas translucens pv. translucens]MBC3972454.1 TonB-dependent receptor [Xanthomonas translucens pv. undulosa]MCC8445464.1 TonB-dependent receptor [Xanthomonas translucens pv. translucens]MCT8276115.1 TonB-dependent receptor [Xanthomonas translucens pv. translucens]
MQSRTERRKTPVTLLALSIGLALQAGIVQAQDVPATASGATEPATQLDTVTVTGYRASVEKALDIKRGEAGVVDAIVAEDVGKFPDLNLAESLQRIPGVVITREAGEGRSISVRGLGPDFTRVRINGMEALTTVGAGDQSGGTNRGRGFDFNVFASDLFSQLIVRKTASADVEEGSLGATVDLKTARPFDYSGFTFVASGQAGYNAMAQKADPRLAALISNTFADGTFGALLSVAYSERQALEEGSNTGRWAGGTSNGGFAASSPYAAARAANVYQPRFPRYVQMEHAQKRLGVTGSLQWKPSDATEIALDTLYSKIDAERDEHYIEAISFSRNRDAATGAARRPDRDGKPTTIVRNGEIRNNALVYGEFDNADIRSENRHDEWNTVFKQIGLSAQHRFSDDVTLSGKVGTSRSRHENPVQTTIIMDKYDVDGYSYDYRGNSRAPVINYGIDTTDPRGWELAEIRLRPQYVDNDFDTGQIDFNWNISPGFRLKGGVLAKDYTFKTVELRRASESTVPNFANGTKLVPVDMTGQAGLKGIAGSPSNWVIPDLNAFVDGFDLYSNSGLFAVAPRSNNSRRVEEKDRGAYLMGEFSTDLGNIPLSGNIGVRYVRTKQASTGYALINNVPTQTTVERSYDDTLPSFNLVAEVTPDFLIRLGAAKVMTRPGLGSLTPGVTVAVAGGARTVSGGNPDLDPIRATNVDLGFEWYFDEGAMAGVGLFYKDIDSFIQTAREVRPYSSSGLPASLLDGTNASVNDDFTFSIPLNTPGGKLKGVEANYIQPFTFLPGKWSNLGVQLNYTWVDSQIQYLDNTGKPVMKNDLTGLSKSSWNATVFYEGEVFSGRVSATNRDDYLTQAPGTEAGFNVDGTHGMTGTTVIDASLRYRISEQLELSLEGINLTNEASDEWVYSPTTGRLPLQYTETGRQYLLGVRYKF